MSVQGFADIYQTSRVFMETSLYSYSANATTNSVANEDQRKLRDMQALVPYFCIVLAFGTFGKR